jgi:hypothetical protein
MRCSNYCMDCWGVGARAIDSRSINTVENPSLANCSFSGTRLDKTPRSCLNFLTDIFVASDQLACLAMSYSSYLWFYIITSISRAVSLLFTGSFGSTKFIFCIYLIILSLLFKFLTTFWATRCCSVSLWERFCWGWYDIPVVGRFDRNVYNEKLQGYFWLHRE